MFSFTKSVLFGLPATNSLILFVILILLLVFVFKLLLLFALLFSLFFSFLLVIELLVKFETLPFSFLLIIILFKFLIIAVVALFILAFTFDNLPVKGIFSDFDFEVFFFSSLSTSVNFLFFSNSLSNLFIMKCILRNLKYLKTCTKLKIYINNFEL